VIGLPPSFGTDQLTVAEASPASPVTPPGAAGAVADADGLDVGDGLGLDVVPVALNSRTAISQVVDPPVPAVADAAVPTGTVRSSASSSMSFCGELLARWVYPEPAVSVAWNPEST